MRIGIVLTGDYVWAGGLYYSLNLVKLLSQISSEKNLKIVVIVNALTPREILNEIPVENVEVNNLDQKSVIYKLYHKLLGTRFIADFNALKLDILYPLITYKKEHEKLNCKIYYWLFDFQHKFLPHMFSQEEIQTRDKNFENIANNGKYIVFSSNDAQSHFQKYYPESIAQLNVYHFVSLIDRSGKVEINCRVPEKYLIVSNQFWQHKNHLTVLKAINHLQQNGTKINVVFTGKLDYPLSIPYVKELKEFIEKKQIHTNITFTGFLSRNEQIQIMENSVAVIQPSLFEGWSTVIEDAKALNKFILASSIDINHEQLKENVMFFEPQNFEQLALLMAEVYTADRIICDFEYSKSIDKSKKNLISVFEIK